MKALVAICVDEGSQQGHGGRHLRDLIAAGKAKPSQIISHELPLDNAPEGYKNFDERKNGWTKVVMKAAA